jgi:membrane-bound lytic murein transglycosylase A
MQAIRDYLARNPDERDPILHHNESYVFFRWTEGGPFGSLGAKLVPFASAAVDPRFYPPGSILLLEREIPAPGGARRAFRASRDDGTLGPGRVASLTTTRRSQEPKSLRPGGPDFQATRNQSAEFEL